MVVNFVASAGVDEDGHRELGKLLSGDTQPAAVTPAGDAGDDPMPTGDAGDDGDAGDAGDDPMPEDSDDDATPSEETTTGEFAGTASEAWEHLVRLIAKDENLTH